MGRFHLCSILGVISGIVIFAGKAPLLIGRTATGRTTIVVLKINYSEAVAARAALVEAGLFPPD